MIDLLSVDTIAFSVLGYPMSYLELVGTVLYLWSVWLISRKKILTWPVGIASVLLYMLLFYQIRLYSDTLEQVYYVGASLYGWYWWKKDAGHRMDVSSFGYSSPRGLMLAVALTGILSLVLGSTMSYVHLWLPAVFPEEASFPFLDALTTIMSFTAMWLMARKRVESWLYWIVVDVLAIYLYFVKDVRFVALLYVVLLVMAINGLRLWSRRAPVEPVLAYLHT
jgi:nicotinamide mononucleotide transporter